VDQTRKEGRFREEGGPFIWRGRVPPSKGLLPSRPKLGFSTKKLTISQDYWPEGFKG